MRSKVVRLAWVVTFALLLSRGAVRATLTPPYILVNHSTQQCYETILGDECMWCDPAPGWEVLGASFTTQCPAGYTPLERLELDCAPYKNQFCCTGGSHGPGDYDGLIVNASQELCAFMADSAGCAVLEGWAKRPIDARASSWVCPYGYQWVAAVACLVETATAEPTRTTETRALTEPTRTSKPGGCQDHIGDFPEQWFIQRDSSSRDDDIAPFARGHACRRAEALAVAV